MVLLMAKIVEKLNWLYYGVIVLKLLKLKQKELKNIKIVLLVKWQVVLEN
jgi:hypothetical protein